MLPKNLFAPSNAQRTGHPVKGRNRAGPEQPGTKPRDQNTQQPAKNGEDSGPVGEKGLDHKSPVARRKGTEGKTEASGEENHKDALVEGATEEVEEGQGKRQEFVEGSRAMEKIKERVESDIPCSWTVNGKVGL